MILGRRSYDEWAEFWPGSEIEPFASFINAVPKYVATSTPLAREWTGASVIDGEAGRLRTAPEGWAGRRHRGPRQHLAHPDAARCRVVDELRLVIAPTIVGSGARLLDRLPPDPARDDPQHRLPSGHLLVDYHVVRETR